MGSDTKMLRPGAELACQNLLEATEGAMFTLDPSGLHHL